ncbi:hypothetical protein ACTXT7_012100 [Hymenolepis weldensis]
MSVQKYSEKRAIYDCLKDFLVKLYPECFLSPYTLAALLSLKKTRNLTDFDRLSLSYAIFVTSEDIRKRDAEPKLNRKENMILKVKPVNSTKASSVYSKNEAVCEKFRLVGQIKVAEANERITEATQLTALSKLTQKKSEKRKQHPEPNPAVGTEMKPNLKLNYVKQM